MNRLIGMWLYRLILIGLSGCRTNFTIRTVDGLNVVMKSSGQTTYPYSREFFLRYDLPNGCLYTYQEGGLHETRTIVRAYNVPEGLESEWNIVGSICTDREHSTIQGGVLYTVGYRLLNLDDYGTLWVEDHTGDFCAVNLSKSVIQFDDVRTIKDVIGNDEKCCYILPLGSKYLLLKMLNIKTGEMGLAIFDTQGEKIVNRLGLIGYHKKGDELDLKFIHLSISPAQSIFALVNIDGAILLYDAEMRRVAKLTAHLSPKYTADGSLPPVDKRDWRNFDIEWIDAKSLMVYMRSLGNWWIYNCETAKIEDEGVVALHKKCQSDSTLHNGGFREWMPKVMGRRSFYVCSNWEDSRLFGYNNWIVVCNPDGTEKWQPIPYRVSGVESMFDRWLLAYEF